MELSKILNKKTKVDTQADLELWMWKESIKRKIGLKRKLGKKK